MSTHSADLCVLGVDPGPTTGIVGLRWRRDPTAMTTSQGGHGLRPAYLSRPLVLQADAATALLVLKMLVNARTGWRPANALTVIGAETFVESGPHDRRQSGPAAVTRELLQEMREWLPDMNTRLVSLQATEHKRWNRSSDSERLRRSGLWELTDGMRHARDAARLALYTAVKYGDVRDPILGGWSW